MNKLLILPIILIIGCVFSQKLPSKTQIEKMSDMDKKQLYINNSKNPFVAGVLSILPSFATGIRIDSFSQESSGEFALSGMISLGHLYTGNWRRGLVLGVSTLTYSIVGIFSTPIGNTILISGYLLQAQDAIYLANKYNADLYKNIYDKEPDKEPLKSIIQKLQ